MDIEKLQSELEKVNSSYCELQTYCQKINEEKAELEEMVSSLEYEKTELEEKCAQLEEKLSGSQNQGTSGNEKRFSSAEDTDSIASSTQLLKEITMVEEELNKMTKERDELLEENKMLTRKASPVSNDTSIIKYEQLLEEKEKKVNELQGENMMLNQKIDELMNQLKNAQIREENLEKRLSNEGENAVEGTDELVSKNTLLMEKEREIEELKRQLKDMRNESRLVSPVSGNVPQSSSLINSLNELRQWYKDIESHLYSFFFLIYAVTAFSYFSPDVKTSWPELVGQDGDVAVNKIREECSECNVRVYSQNAPMTMDIRLDRVRVFVDDNNVVVIEPNRG